MAKQHHTTKSQETTPMSSAPRHSAAATDELPKDITELVQMIAALPANFRGEIEPVLERVVESTRRRRRILTLVQEALSQLRLDMKYLVFDLEATRRERDAFRQQNGEEGKEDGSGG
jgi:hypothetical protein